MELKESGEASHSQSGNGAGDENIFAIEFRELSKPDEILLEHLRLLLGSIISGDMYDDLFNIREQGF